MREFLLPNPVAAGRGNASQPFMVTPVMTSLLGFG